MTAKLESIEWVEVEEKLPDAEILVLAYAPGADPEVWPAYIDEEGWTWCEGNQVLQTVTHWAHIPAGPGQV